jgi:hypothetical protein
MDITDFSRIKILMKSSQNEGTDEQDRNMYKC